MTNQVARTIAVDATLKDNIDFRTGGCIKSCRKTAVGRTVAIQSEAVHFLPAHFWDVESVECGDRSAFHDRESLVICWDCALKQGVVNETEKQHDEKTDRVLEKFLK